MRERTASYVSGSDNAVIAIIIAGVLLVVILAVLFVPALLTDGSDTDRPVGEVSLTRTIDANDSGFTFDGEVEFELREQKRVFRNVMVCLYDEENEPIDSVKVGSLDAPSDAVETSIRSDRVPEYVAVVHPEFANIENFDIRIFERRESGYFAETHVSNAEGFRYPSSTDPGQC